MDEGEQAAMMVESGGGVRRTTTSPPPQTDTLQGVYGKCWASFE